MAPADDADADAASARGGFSNLEVEYLRSQFGSVSTAPLTTQLGLAAMTRTVAEGGKTWSKGFSDYFTREFLLDCVLGFASHVRAEAIEVARAFKPGFMNEYRTPPSPAYQFLVSLHRSFRQMFAEHRWGGFVSDCMTMFVVGAVLGYMFGADEWTEEASKLPLRNFITILAVGLTSCLRALGTFGNERPVFWRERNGGVSVFSYFLGKVMCDFIFISIFPMCFLFTFTGVAQPRAQFTATFPVLWLTSFAASAMGYLLSCLFRPEVAKFNGLMAILVCCLFAGVQPPLSFFKGGFLTSIVDLSFARWSQEALQIVEFGAYPELYQGSLNRILAEHGWSVDNLGTCKSSLVALGIGLRIASFLMLKLGNRGRG